MVNNIFRVNNASIYNKFKNIITGYFVNFFIILDNYCLTE